MSSVSAARACALNAGISVVWGAILGLSLQSRAIALAPAGQAVGAYAEIFGTGAAVALVMQIFIGALSDRAHLATGHRLGFYGAGIVLAIPAIVWVYLAPDLGQLFAAFIALEIAMNVVCGPYQAVIPDYVAIERRGAASSWMSAYQSVGTAFGLIVAGLVHDLRIVAAAIVVPLAASGGATIAYLRGLRSQSASDAPTSGTERLRIGGPLAALLLSRGLINVGFYTLLGFLLFFVRDSLGVLGDATVTQTGYVFLIFTICAIPGAVIAAKPTDRYDKRIAVSISIALVTIALAIMFCATSVVVAGAAAALAGLGWGAFVTADWALASAVLPRGGMATQMGIWNVATTVPQVIAPFATAPLVTRLNALHAGFGPRAAIALSAIEFVLGAVAVWRLPRA